MKKWILGLVILIALMLAAPVSATLQVSVTVYDTGNTATGYSNVIVDGGAGDTDGVVNNQISLGDNFQPIPNFIVQGSFHTSKLGGLALITSASNTVINNRATTTRSIVAVSDTEFTPPANFAEVTGSGTWTGAGGSDITLRYYDDPANEQGADVAFADYADFLANVALLTPGDKIAEFSDTAAGGLDSFDYDEDNIVVSDVNPYSMTLYFDFNLTPNGLLVSRGQSILKTATPIPEFPSMALPASLIIGLLGTIMFIRKTRLD